MKNSIAQTSALSLLKNGELCMVVTAVGEREAYWVAITKMFIFADGAEPICIRSNQVDEWMPASVKF